MIFTIGHSNYSINEFIKSLIKHNINYVCDFRSIPYSKFLEHYNYENVKRTLKNHGLHYLFLGGEFGARRGGRIFIYEWDN